MNIWAFPSVYPYDFPQYKSRGIFAHRQYKALMKNGACLQVVQPVFWHPWSILSTLHSEWEKAAMLNYPLQRTYDGITVHHPRIKNMKPSRFFTKPYRERYVDTILRFFKSNNIIPGPEDIFYAQWVPDAYYVKEAAKILGVKFAVMVIGDDVLVLPKQQEDYVDILREVLEAADIRLTVADYLGKEANKLLNANLEFHTIRRGTNYDLFKPVAESVKTQFKKDLSIPPERLIVLCVATAIISKGWLELFDALSKIKNEGYDFLLIGLEGSTSVLNLKEEATKRGLDNDFIGFSEVAPDDVSKFYNVADVFCLPSHSEGIANVVVEAMASAVAVLTTDVSGHPELVSHMENGILIPPQNTEVLKNELVRLITDDKLRTRLGINAREFIIKKWGNAAYNSEKLYRIFQLYTTKG